jgi:hypothetical protein
MPGQVVLFGGFTGPCRCRSAQYSVFSIQFSVASQRIVEGGQYSVFGVQFSVFSAGQVG